MSIVFTPSLGDNLQLTVPSIQDTITLRFTAQLSAQLHAQLKHDRGRVQLWSDLPSLAHTSGGNWCEFDFEETIVDDSPNRNVVKMSLTASPNSLHTTTEHFLTLQVAIPTAIRSQQVQCSFTYRLVYPSGEVKWLGLFGQNGTLVLTRAHDSDPSTNTLFLLDGWKSTIGNTREYYASGSEPTPVEIARFAPMDYRVWAFGSERLLSEPKNASMLFLVPCQRDDHSMVVSPIYTVTASPGTLLDVSFTGSITHSSSQPSTVSLQTRGSSEDPTTFLKRVLDNTNIRLLAYVETHAILGSVQDQIPVQVAIIPMETRKLSNQISLDLADLACTLPSDATDFSIFSPLSLDIRFLTLPLSENGTLSFEIDSTGSDFLLSPVHSFFPTKSSTTNGFWKMTILCPHKPSIKPLRDLDILPTPPPSPRRRPIVKPSVSFAPIDTVITPLPSRVSDVGFSPRERERYLFPNDSPTLSGWMTRPNKEPPRESIYSLIKYLCATFGVFVSVLYRLFGGFIPDIDSDQEETDDEADGDCVVNPDDEEGSHDDIVVVDSDPFVPSAVVSPTQSIGSTQDTSQDGDNTRQISAAQTWSDQALPKAVISSSSPEFYAEVMDEVGQITIAFTRVSLDEDVNTVFKTNPNSIAHVVELNGRVLHGAVRELAAESVGGLTPPTTFFLLNLCVVNGGLIKISPAKLDGPWQ